MSGTVQDESRIRQFYSNANILITGGTGLMGRLLISKLLRSCNDLNSLYLLIRGKKDKDPTTRFNQLLNDPIFSTLSGDITDVRNKMICIPGDCSLPGLGLTHLDRQRLANDVTHVFHAAAMVSFSETLVKAISTNVSGLVELLKLCRSCTRLKSIVYVSSTFAHCVRERVGEVFYNTPIHVEDALQLIRSLSSEKLELIKDGLIAPWPNTYNFSKAVAEDVIKECGAGLPIGVFRPSIGTSEEPVPGWINNLYGPTGVVAGVGMGMLRVLKIDTRMRADLVPADMAINALICASWDVHNKYKINMEIKTNDAALRPLNIPIYNFVTSEANPITWDEYLSYSMKYGMKIPPSNALWYINLTTTTSVSLYKLLVLLYHTIPALCIDSWLTIIGKKRRMMKAYKKIHKFSQVISYFTTKEWNFEHSNTDRLWLGMVETDRNLFNFDMKGLDWDLYFKRTMSGVRKYLFHDEKSTIPYARRRMFVLHVCHQIVKIIFIAVCLLPTIHATRKIIS